MNHLISEAVGFIALYGMDLQMPFMVLTFLSGFFLRSVIYFTVRCEYLFALEFEKRVHKHLADPEKNLAPNSFHLLSKKILERTYHEHFELKQKYKRRRLDHVTTITDRLLLIQAGANRLVKDTLSQTRYLKKVGGRDAKFLDISKFVFSSNPVFNKVFAVFSMGMFNDILNLMPGLFVIGGIFGTFLGTMQALPALSQLDITNAEATKHIMDTFLLKMAHCMSSSIVGIGLSVCMTIVNAVLSPEGMYLEMVNKFASSLEFLWNDTDTNELGASEFRQEEADPDRRASPQPKRLRTWVPKSSVKAAQPAATPVVESPSPADAEIAAVDHLAETQTFVPDQIPELQPVPIRQDQLAETMIMRRDRILPDDDGENTSQDKTVPGFIVPLAGPEGMEVLETSSNLLEMLKLRLSMIEAYREKAQADRDAGILPEALWAQENNRWLAEKDKVEHEIQIIAGKRKAVA